LFVSEYLIAAGGTAILLLSDVEAVTAASVAVIAAALILARGYLHTIVTKADISATEKMVTAQAAALYRQLIDQQQNPVAVSDNLAQFPNIYNGQAPNYDDFDPVDPEPEATG
jgi:hypothetical protein